MSKVTQIWKVCEMIKMVYVRVVAHLFRTKWPDKPIRISFLRPYWISPIDHYPSSSAVIGLRSYFDGKVTRFQVATGTKDQAHVLNNTRRKNYNGTTVYIFSKRVWNRRLPLTVNQKHCTSTAKNCSRVKFRGLGIEQFFFFIEKKERV